MSPPHRMGAKYETRGKQPSAIDLFARADKQNVDLFGLFLATEWKHEMPDVSDGFHRINDAHPDVPPPSFPHNALGGYYLPLRI